jgi:hypothetical protein
VQPNKHLKAPTESREINTISHKESKLTVTTPETYHRNEQKL